MEAKVSGKHDQYKETCQSLIKFFFLKKESIYEHFEVTATLSIAFERTKFSYFAYISDLGDLFLFRNIFFFLFYYFFFSSEHLYPLIALPFPFLLSSLENKDERVEVD